MAVTMHPRMRARIEQVEQQRAHEAERELLAALADVEALALRLDALAGTSMAKAIGDTCAIFRRSLKSHDPRSAAGQAVRRFMPDRIRELRADCEATASAMSVGPGL